MKGSNKIFPIKKNSKKPKTSRFQLQGCAVEVIQKDIKNINLSVRPPDGHVRISAPRNMSVDTIHVFFLAKLDWIKRQQAKLLTQTKHIPFEYIEGENHYFKGEPYRLKIITTHGTTHVVLNEGNLELHIHATASTAKRQAAVETWYRNELKKIIPTIINKYAKKMKLEVNEIGVKKMKTRWGTCNPTAKRIWLNLELAKKSPTCLEYVVLHEMAHFIEHKHNKRFYALMTQYMPLWRSLHDELKHAANV